MARSIENAAGCRILIEVFKKLALRKQPNNRTWHTGSVRYTKKVNA